VEVMIELAAEAPVLELPVDETELMGTSLQCAC
jgi:hypothetical protein